MAKDNDWCDEEDNDMPSGEDRAEMDEYMGSAYEHYISDDHCDDSEWAAVGKEWAKDMLENNDMTEEEYQEACEYYDNYSY